MSELTLADAFRLFEGLTSTQSWSMLIVVADQDQCWLVSSDGTKCTVRTAAAQPKKGRPSAVVTLWYKTTDLATRDFRGEISEAQWMKLYTLGFLRFNGSMVQAKKLEEPFKAMLARHVAEGGKAPPESKATQPPADAPASLEAGYAPLVEDPGVDAKAKTLDEELAGYEEVAVAQPWWRVHFGTDMLLGCWLTQLGCVIYVLVVLQIVAATPGRLDKWLELTATFIFVAGCHYLIQGSYPTSMASMLEKFAAMPDSMAPPGASATYLERHILKADLASFLQFYVTGSDLMISTTLFTVGMLPFLLEGLLNMIFPPKDDPPGAAATLFFGVLISLPPLLWLQKSTAVDAFRGQSRSGGSSRVWDGCLRECVCRLAGESQLPYWERHLGLDGLVGVWTYFWLMALTLVTVVPLWLLDPDDSEQLCGVSMSCAANVYMMIPFTAGAYLLARSMYPEHANGSILFPADDPDAEDEPREAPSEQQHGLGRRLQEAAGSALLGAASALQTAASALKESASALRPRWLATSDPAPRIVDTDGPTPPMDGKPLLEA